MRLRALPLLFILTAACGDEAPPEAPDGGSSALGDPAPTGDDGTSAEPAGEAASARIGPEGGTLRSADGALTLEVPPGALSAAQTLSVQPLAPALPLQAGQMYRLEPEGIHFAKPAVLTLRFDDDDVAGSTPELLRAVYRDAAGWHMLKQAEVDAAAHTLRVQTAHFSDWSLVLGAQIQPLQAEVDVQGELALRVVSCMTPHEERDGEVAIEFGYDCEDEPTLNAIAIGWSVDGVIGGTEASGRLHDDGDATRNAVRYQAPAQAPAQNPVAVSVELRDYTTPLFGTQVLVSNVRVRDPSARWSGTISYEAVGALDVAIPADFTGSERHTWSSKTSYSVTGVSERNGPRTELTLTQVSDVAYDEDGARRKEVHEICQAGGPVILRHLFEYQIASWQKGHVEAAIAGSVYIDRDDGSYDISLDTADIPVDGQEVVVDKYTHFCDGSVLDDSGTRELHTVDNSGDSFFEGKIDPSEPTVLRGGYEKTLNDAYGTRVTVSWDLTRGDER